MVTEVEIPIEERIFRLLQRLGINEAHFAARVPWDWQAFVRTHPQSVASLTLLCPRPSDSRSLLAVASCLQVVTGDQGKDAEGWRHRLEDLPDARLVTLRDYLPVPASDVAADRTEEVGKAMLEFLARMDRERKPQRISPPEGDGDEAGILYRIQGSGPPLMLFPLHYSPSGWDHLLPLLSQSYCTITVGGANLGAVVNLESRAKGGYLEVVGKVVDEARLQPGEKVLDVGCGPGSLDRWLAHRTGGANPITGLDPSTHLLREAAGLVKSEGLDGVVEFREGSGDSLPFPDSSFDVAMSFTAMQFVDADRMMSEMVRVIKPGGRVAVLARGDDHPNIINAPLRAELKAKAESQRMERFHKLGCNDAGLYRRFHQAGLTQVKMFPQLAIFTPSSDGANLSDLHDRVVPALSAAETEEYYDAVAQAQADGSFFVAELFHCAVGTKP